MPEKEMTEGGGRRRGGGGRKCFRKDKDSVRVCIGGVYIYVNGQSNRLFLFIKQLGT